MHACACIRACRSHLSEIARALRLARSCVIAGPRPRYAVPSPLTLTERTQTRPPPEFQEVLTGVCTRSTRRVCSRRRRRTRTPTRSGPRSTTSGPTSSTKHSSASCPSPSAPTRTVASDASTARNTSQRCDGRRDVLDPLLFLFADSIQFPQLVHWFVSSLAG
jgi:hypothetical protein